MTKIESIHFTYAELFQNVFKRLLLLAGKLAGYKGFAVLIATVLLRLGYIGDAAWASVVISALCGAVLPKALGSYAAMDSSMDVGGKENEPFSYNAKIAAVVLAVNMVFPASAEKLFLTEKAESETQLKMQDLPPDQTLGNETLAAELERILEETVDEALFLQQEGLKAQFEKENRRILKSRSFWRKTALCEFAVILGAAFTGGVMYRLRN